MALFTNIWSSPVRAKASETILNYAGTVAAVSISSVPIVAAVRAIRTVSRFLSTVSTGATGGIVTFLITFPS
jgi:hypothetical protein